jgi:hypothetical protein
MDPKPFLSKVKNDLLTSHDVKNTQIRLYQLAKNPELLLSEGQRGAMNFYSSFQDVDESVLVRLIDSIQTPSSLDNSIQTIETNIEPVVKKTQHGNYKWSLIQYSEDPPKIMEIDPAEYTTSKDAQDKADQFMTGLNEGDQKNWIRLAIVQFSKSSHFFEKPCQATILKIHANYYALITQHINEPMTKEIQEQKTVHFTNKVLTVESYVDPIWVTRGFIPKPTHDSNASSYNTGIYYVLYKIKQLQKITELTNNLQTLLC